MQRGGWGCRAVGVLLTCADLDEPERADQQDADHEAAEGDSQNRLQAEFETRI